MNAEFMVARLSWYCREGNSQNTSAATAMIRAPARFSVEVVGNQYAFHRAIQAIHRHLTSRRTGGPDR